MLKGCRAPLQLQHGRAALLAVLRRYARLEEHYGAAHNAGGEGKWQADCRAAMYVTGSIATDKLD